jgi:glutamine phosphoribosylpyrophosphate amidotransferase
MCGVIGVALKDVTDEDIGLVENLFLESMIRGKHATGITYLKDGNLVTVKEPIPAAQFLSTFSIEDCVDNGKLRLIGHIRYSTSDLRHNQPFSNENLSIAHNGVISQDPNVWEFETDTENDSELILQAFDNRKHPLDIYKDRSMAVVRITHKAMVGFRNHERPLWYTERENGLVFASTKDILSRTGFDTPSHRCEPFVEYVHRNFNSLVENRLRVNEDYEDLQP